MVLTEMLWCVAPQHVAEQLEWDAVDKLERLEGFKDPWEFVVYRGRAVNLDASLQDNGITADAVITVVRRVLLPEAWKVGKRHVLLNWQYYASHCSCGSWDNPSLG